MVRTHHEPAEPPGTLFPGPWPASPASVPHVFPSGSLHRILNFKPLKPISAAALSSSPPPLSPVHLLHQGALPAGGGPPAALSAAGV